MNEHDADYVDALDHIMRVARASRTKTRRLRWIEGRARCALGGGDWRDLDMPKDVDRENFRLKGTVARLQFERRELREALEQIAAIRLDHCIGPHGMALRMQEIASAAIARAKEAN